VPAAPYLSFRPSIRSSVPLSGNLNIPRLTPMLCTVLILRIIEIFGSNLCVFNIWNDMMAEQILGAEYLTVGLKAKNNEMLWRGMSNVLRRLKHNYTFCMKYTLCVESYEQKYSHYHLLFDKYNPQDVHDVGRAV